MKCYICLTDSIATRKDYFDLLKVTLISARKNTSLSIACLYDGKVNDVIYNLLTEFSVEIILHQLPYKKELMEIFTREWMLQHLGKEIDYNRIFGTFMRMEIPVIEKEEEYVLYSDMDVIFNRDILLEDLPHPKYLAAAPERERDITKMEYFNAGVLVLNVQGMKVKYEQFINKLEKREIPSQLFDQGYLNDLCFKDMELLPLEYNWKPYWGINNKAKIIHFHGMKPNSIIQEAGFTTDNSFYKIVFSENQNGYAGYVYYFIQFFDYLNNNREDLWIYNHLQEIFNLYKSSKLPPASNDKYKLKYKKYKKLYLVTLTASCLLLIVYLMSILK